MVVAKPGGGITSFKAHIIKGKRTGVSIKQTHRPVRTHNPCGFCPDLAYLQPWWSPDIQLLVSFRHRPLVWSLRGLRSLSLSYSSLGAQGFPEFHALALLHQSPRCPQANSPFLLFRTFLYDDSDCLDSSGMFHWCKATHLEKVVLVGDLAPNLT